MDMDIQCPQQDVNRSLLKKSYALVTSNWSRATCQQPQQQLDSAWPIPSSRAPGRTLLDASS